MFVLFKNRGLLTLSGDKNKIVDPISKETKNVTGRGRNYSIITAT